jgi:hypothetical protein
MIQTHPGANNISLLFDGGLMVDSRGFFCLYVIPYGPLAGASPLVADSFLLPCLFELEPSQPRCVGGVSRAFHHKKMAAILLIAHPPHHTSYDVCQLLLDSPTSISFEYSLFQFLRSGSYNEPMPKFLAYYVAPFIIPLVAPTPSSVGIGAPLVAPPLLSCRIGCSHGAWLVQTPLIEGCLGGRYLLISTRRMVDTSSSQISETNASLDVCDLVTFKPIFDYSFNSNINLSSFSLAFGFYIFGFLTPYAMDLASPIASATPGRNRPTLVFADVMPSIKCSFDGERRASRKENMTAMSLIVHSPHQITNHVRLVSSDSIHSTYLCSSFQSLRYSLVLETNFAILALGSFMDFLATSPLATLGLTVMLSNQGSIDGEEKASRKENMTAMSPIAYPPHQSSYHVSLDSFTIYSFIDIDSNFQILRDAPLDGLFPIAPILELGARPPASSWLLVVPVAVAFTSLAEPRWSLPLPIKWGDPMPNFSTRDLVSSDLPFQSAKACIWGEPMPKFSTRCLVTHQGQTTDSPSLVAPGSPATTSLNIRAEDHQIGVRITTQSGEAKSIMINVKLGQSFVTLAESMPSLGW